MFTSLKQFRNTVGLSQEQMALKLLVDIKTYAGYELGKHRPQRSFYFLLAHEFNYPVDQLLTIAGTGQLLHAK